MTLPVSREKSFFVLSAFILHTVCLFQYKTSSYRTIFVNDIFFIVLK